MTFVTCLAVIVRVAGATLTETGIQLFLTLPLTAVSRASFITSIPVDKKKKKKNTQYWSIRVTAGNHGDEHEKMCFYQLALRPPHFQDSKPGTAGSSHFWGQEIL